MSPPHEGVLGSDNDDKADFKNVEDTTQTSDSVVRPVLTFEPPPLVRNLSPQERLELETRLKRKIDMRLLPSIILIYIMNYLDRVSLQEFRNVTN